MTILCFSQVVSWPDTWNTEAGLVLCSMELQAKLGPYIFAPINNSCSAFLSSSGLIFVPSIDPIPSSSAPLANFLTFSVQDLLPGFYPEQ